MKEVIQNYFSEATSFKIYDETMNELPSITFCPLQVTNTLQYGKEFIIKYSFDGIILMEGKNMIHHDTFNETVTVQTLSTRIVL